MSNTIREFCYFMFMCACYVFHGCSCVDVRVYCASMMHVTCVCFHMLGCVLMLLCSCYRCSVVSWLCVCVFVMLIFMFSVVHSFLVDLNCYVMFSIILYVSASYVVSVYEVFNCIVYVWWWLMCMLYVHLCVIVQLVWLQVYYVECMWFVF